MPVQLILKVRDRQPNNLVHINQNNPIVRGLIDVTAPFLKPIVPVDSPTKKTTRSGIGFNGNGSTASGWYKTARITSLDTTKPITIFAVVNGSAGATDSRAYSITNASSLIFSIGAGVTSASKMRLWFRSPGTDQGSGETNSTVFENGVTHTAAVRYTPGILESFVDGKADVTSAATNLGTATGPMWCSTNTLWREYASGRNDSSVLLGLVFSRALSNSEISILSANPWQIFEPETIPLFYAAGGGATDLSIFDALHNHAGDNLGFSLDTYLAAQDSSHAHAADNLTLDASTAISLILSDSLHGMSSDVIAFITGSYLQVADSLHGHSADVLSLATASFLVVAEALHAHSADNLTLDTSNATPLTLQDALHAQSADNNVFTLDSWLAIVEVVHAHSADNVSISSEELLAVADALHSLASDSLVLTLPSPPGTCPTVDEIKVAVWQHIIESGVSAEAMLRIVSAVLAGKVSGANTGVETFVGIDGVTNRVVSTVDSVGNRTSVSVDGS